MVDLYLELYRKEIPERWAQLPGAGNSDPLSPDMYFAVLVPKPSPGSEEEAYIAPVGPDEVVGATTHGTDTLPEDATAFFPTQICIIQPKSPPYKFEVTTPTNDTILLDPPHGSAPYPEVWWHCITVPPNDGIGVWVIRVIPFGVPDLPVSINNRNAHLVPNDINFDASHFYHQPLLRVIGDFEQSECGEITGIIVDGCAPGTVQFSANVSSYGIDEITWNFGDLSPSVVGPANISHSYGSLEPGSVFIVSCTILRPEGCTPRTQTATAVVSRCNGTGCPESMIDSIRVTPDPECNNDGTRNITVEAFPNSDAHPIGRFRWEFSDSSIAPIDIEGGVSPTRTIPVTAPGTDDISLTVTLALTREDGCIDIKYQTVTFKGCGAKCPVITNITIDPDICITTDRKRYNVNATIEGAGVVKYTWDFGDGTSEEIDAPSDPSITHNYPAPGSYELTLKIEGPGNCESTSDPITVTVPRCDDGRGIRGCTDPNALNYNPYATINDGSCRYDGEPPRKGPCRNLVWLAVILFALGILLIAFHQCMGAAGTYALVVGIILIALYGILMAVVALLKKLKICKIKWCKVAAIHMIVLGPLGVILGFAAWLVPCFYQPVWYIFSPVAGAWATKLARCKLRK